MGTLKIGNLTKWKQLEPGEALSLKGRTDAPRRVKLTLNCPKPTRFDALDGMGAAFLAVVTGYQEIWFEAQGEVVVTPLVPEGEQPGEVFYFTDDGEVLAVERPDPVIFTKVMERQPQRNPELEHAMRRMNLNVERRMQAMEAQFQQREAAWAERERKRQEAEANANGAGHSSGEPGTATPPAEGGADPQTGEGGAAAEPAAGVPAGQSSTK